MDTFFRYQKVIFFKKILVQIQTLTMHAHSSLQKHMHANSTSMNPIKRPGRLDFEIDKVIIDTSLSTERHLPLKA